MMSPDEEIKRIKAERDAALRALSNERIIAATDRHKGSTPTPQSTWQPARSSLTPHRPLRKT